ncbi:MAG: hypothetical protein JWM28_2314 [Chitinophagaceae bacterium]|nr:hypothetical protein [Chitinophagaceae bacterium]
MNALSSISFIVVSRRRPACSSICFSKSCPLNLSTLQADKNSNVMNSILSIIKLVGISSYYHFLFFLIGRLLVGGIEFSTKVFHTRHNGNCFGPCVCELRISSVTKGSKKSKDSDKLYRLT